MRAVLDTNIAVALLVTLPYSENAHDAVSNAKEILAPDLIIPEAANTFWKITQADMARIFHARKALSYLPSLFDRVTASKDVADEALMLALEYGHPAYECIYLATAKKENATLITADRRLHNLADRAGIKAQLVKS